jgi:hypothetical protein
MESKSHGWRAIVDVSEGKRKYVEYDTGEIELYDLEADPNEMESIHASAGAGTLEDLHAKLEALASCSGEGCS